MQQFFETVGVENSSWNNIGDAFYANSVESIVSQVLPGSLVAPIESPHLRSFRPLVVPSQSTYCELGLSQICDLAVLCGPILNHFRGYYHRLISHFMLNKIPYIMLSIHGTIEKSGLAIDCINSYPPLLIVTRDSSTFEFLRHRLTNVPVYNSLCFAYYSSRLIPALPLASSASYLASSIYKKRSPNYKTLIVDRIINDVDYRESWLRCLSVQPSSSALKRFLRARRRNTSETTVDGYKVIHSVHDTSHKLTDLAYSEKPAYFSRRPEGYLSIYKSASLTITDRVHAAIATLSHGVPAIYTSTSFRDGAITNCNVADSCHNLYRARQDVIDEKLQEVKLVIAKHLN